METGVLETEISGVVVIQPQVFEDSRGYFFESFSQRRFEQMIGKTVFVQDNESKSSYGVVRGLHYQLPPYAQAKLVRVVRGRIWDVAVDLRRGSATFGKYVAVELTEDNKWQFFIPRGFAHGFSVLSEEAVVQYKCDSYYVPQAEGGISFDDPELAIDWKIPREDMVLSPKDLNRPGLCDAYVFDV
ncbi:MAG: dTDP-4-dehydrorhamnose 3,5-epimerase [Oscillibacter sp.]|nr:dTDP-4-dehydrorhamnose 3,5-epimerase [Oscillibacter sp.]